MTAHPKVLILRAPGTNCDAETAFAFEKAGAAPSVLHIRRVIEQPALIREFQILCIPGGFSYGDDIASGRILAVHLRRALDAEMHEFRSAGKLILGICNGFQALLKSGLLLDDEPANPTATLAWNTSGRFEDRWVALRTQASECVFLRSIETLELPIAHGEGRFVPRDPQALAALDQAGQLVLRYTHRLAAGKVAQSATAEAADELDSAAVLGYPDNPNGSLGNVAGACDRSGRVFGLMPHPERFIDPTQHPRWTRGPHRKVGDGLAIFANAVAFFS